MKGLFLILIFITSLCGTSLAQSNDNSSVKANPNSQNTCSLIIPYETLSPLPIRKLKWISILFVIDERVDSLRERNVKATNDLIVELKTVLGYDEMGDGTIMLDEVRIK